MMLYFAYGSNLDRAAMRQRCPDARALGTATLSGYRFSIGREGWASVRPERGAVVHGVLWRVSLRDRAALHAYELVDKGLYEARMLPVRHAGRLATALVYLLRRRAVGRARPGYLEAVAAAAREWRLPERYVQSIERWRVSPVRGARA